MIFGVLNTPLSRRSQVFGVRCFFPPSTAIFVVRVVLQCVCRIDRSVAVLHFTAIFSRCATVDMPQISVDAPVPRLAGFCACIPSGLMNLHRCVKAQVAHIFPPPFVLIVIFEIPRVLIISLFIYFVQFAPLENKLYKALFTNLKNNCKICGGTAQRKWL